MWTLRLSVCRIISYNISNVTFNDFSTEKDRIDVKAGERKVISDNGPKKELRYPNLNRKNPSFALQQLKGINSKPPQSELTRPLTLGKNMNLKRITVYKIK